MKDQVAILKPILENQKKQMRDIMEEEKTLIQEMKYLLEKALRDGKVVSSLNFFMWVHAQNVNYSRYIVSLT